MVDEWRASEKNKSRLSVLDTGHVRKLPPGVAAFRRVRDSYQEGAHRRGLAFDLSESELLTLIKGVCYYCGIPPSRIRKTHGGDGILCNGIDRIDSTKGYALGNVRTCCTKCNFLKMAKTEAEFVDIIRHAFRVARHLGIDLEH